MKTVVNLSSFVKRSILIELKKKKPKLTKFNYLIIPNSEMSKAGSIFLEGRDRQSPLHLYTMILPGSFFFFFFFNVTSF